MKPYNELTRLGRLRRLRELGSQVLEQYGLAEARLTFLQYEGNVTFRVDAPETLSITTPKEPYLDNRYLLRIHTTTNMAGVESELTWLDALSREAGLPVREPVPTIDGRLLLKVDTLGVPQGKIVSLMRWIDARRLTSGFRPTHFRSWGQITARTHEFATGWQPPEGFQRPHWDWEGQLGGGEFPYPLDELVDAMPDRYREPFQIVSRRAREVMDGLGKKPEAYGLIHGDMYPENVLFKAGRAYPIDFEDCGYGYWIWDIAVALCYWPWTEEWYWMRDAFLEGYLKERPLPESQLQHLDLFMAAQYATMVLWATMFIRHDPAMQTEHEAWRKRDGEKLLRYFERG